MFNDPLVHLYDFSYNVLQDRGDDCLIVWGEFCCMLHVDCIFINFF